MVGNKKKNSPQRKKKSSKANRKSKKPAPKSKAISKSYKTKKTKSTISKKRKAPKPKNKPKKPINKKATTNKQKKSNKSSKKVKNTINKTPKKKARTRASKVGKMTRKKIDDKWRDVYYYRDPKGKIRERRWGDYRKMTSVHQPKNLKASQRTMEKQIPANISRGMKAIAKDENEHSFMIDFEKRLTQPQRIVIMKGGKTSTIKINDFEFFGHSHPDTKNTTPSLGDMRGLKPLTPEFIIAGKTGKTSIYNIENPEKLKKHLWHKSHLKMDSTPVEAGDIERQKRKMKYKDDPTVKNITPYNIADTKKGREMFLDITGVKAYPLKEKATFVEMKDDPKLEKQVPTVPKQYLEQYHKESGVK